VRGLAVLLAREAALGSKVITAEARKFPHLLRYWYSLRVMIPI
jgi:hypothetical protein